MAADELQHQARMLRQQAKRVEREVRILKQMAAEVENRAAGNLEPEEAEGGRRSEAQQ